jgi:Mab-21 protein
LKALVRVEPQLDGISSYHVRTASLYTFDRIVDDSSCWQRQSTVSAFLDLLTELDQHLAHGCMPHFFFRQLDLLSGVPIQTVQKWRSRIRYLVVNRGELMRVLIRRTEDRLAATTVSDAKTI